MTSPFGTLDYRTEYHKLPRRQQKLDFYVRVRRFWREFPPTRL